MTDPVRIFYFPFENQNILCEVYPPHPRTKQKKITLSIASACHIKIKAPLHTPDTVLKETIYEHIHWITKQLQSKPEPPKYTSGEQHYYLGKKYSLRIIENVHGKQNVQLKDDCLLLSLHYYTPYKAYALLDSWYRFQALHLFSKQIMSFKPVIKWIDWQTTPPLLRIKKMHSRWGSYISRSPDVITLNQHLIKADLHCINYVILHELCHAAEPNHSSKFYALVAKIMPNWKIWQSQLQQQGGLFLQGPPPQTKY